MVLGEAAGLMNDCYENSWVSTCARRRADNWARPIVDALQKRKQERQEGQEGQEKKSRFLSFLIFLSFLPAFGDVAARDVVEFFGAGALHEEHFHGFG